MPTPRFLMLSLLLSACAPAFVEPVPSQDASQRELGPDRAIEALFAPDDAPIDTEVAHIRGVIDARRADGADYDADTNPYRIRYAVYNLRNDAVVSALADARDAGVDVQVLIDDDQLDPARDWNTADEVLASRGWAVADDHRDLDEKGLLTTPLIGIGGSGLMHLKTRIFETPQGRIVATGSMNPGDNAVFNDESWHLIRDPRITERYAAAYEALLWSAPIQNTWDDEALNVLFSPAEGPSAGGRILDWLAEEDEQILLMVYSLRDITAPGHSDSLVDILAERVAAGVPVVLITDRKQSDAWGDTTEDRLRDVGVRVYEATNTTNEFTAMHHKTAILGRSHLRVITDAANWSTSGLGSSRSKATNVESTLFIDEALDDGHLGRRTLAQFMRTLDRYAAQSADDGEPSFDAMRDLLVSAEDWPAQPVRFTVHDATTAWGESVHVLGDADALGRWGTVSDGVKLGTDAASYPRWSGDDTAWLPVGLPIAYKFVATNGGAPRWEPGKDRTAFVQAEPFGTDALQLEGTWQR